MFGSWASPHGRTPAFELAGGRGQASHSHIVARLQAVLTRAVGLPDVEVRCSGECGRFGRLMLEANINPE